MTPPEFRAQLLDAMRNSATELDFAGLVATTGTDRSVADEVARSIYAKYVAKMVEDRDYTPAERSRADKLAEILEISRADAIDLAEKVREDRYRTELLQAEADGNLTDDEEATLYGLRVALGLAVVPIGSLSRSPVQSGLASGPATSAGIVDGLEPHTASDLSQQLFRSVNTPSGLLGELDAIHEGDKLAEKKQRQWTWISFGSFLLAAVTLCFAFVSQDQLEAGALIVPAVFFVVGMTSLVLRSHHVKLNFDDRRYTIAHSVLECLSRDTDSSSLVGLNLDFNRYHSKKYRSDNTKDSFFWSTRIREYELPWLTMKGRLLDGTRFRLSVTQCVKRKEKRKRKYTKVTEAFRDKISLTLQVKPRQIAHLPAAVQMLKGSRKLNAGLILHSVSSSDNRLVVQTVTQRQCRTSGRGTGNSDAEQKTSNHHHVLKLFLACYDALGRASEAGTAA